MEEEASDVSYRGRNSHIVDYWLTNRFHCLNKCRTTRNINKVVSKHIESWEDLQRGGSCLEPFNLCNPSLWSWSVLQVVPPRPSPSSPSMYCTNVLATVDVGLAGRHVTLVLALITWSTMSCNCCYRLIFAENRWCRDIWRAHGTPTPPRPARGPAPHSVLCLPLLLARSLLITFTTCSSYTRWCR